MFLNRVLTGRQVRRSARASKLKVANIVHVRHRDEVEAPVTDWLQEAYALAGAAVVAKPVTRTAARLKAKGAATTRRNAATGKRGTVIRRRRS